MKMIKKTLPLPVFTKGRGKKKRELLVSLNNFFPMHYIAKNNTKQAYHKVVEDWASELPEFKTIQVSYTLYFNNKRKKDLDNYTFPMHKFLMDALVENGVIDDDNYEYVTAITTKFGGLREKNCVIVEIKGELLNS